MILDANANVGPTVYRDFEFEPTLDALEEHLTAAGIDEAIVSPLKPPSLDFDQANAHLAASLANREEFHGVARIDPRVADAVDNAKRALDEYSFNGLKLHPHEETYSIRANFVEPVLEVAADRDVPVWIEGGYANQSHPLRVRAVAQSFPKVTFVLSHGCHLDISGLSVADALRLASETDNTVFEFSGVYRHDFILDVIADIGAERAVFGSNAPYFHPQVELSRITKSALSEEDKETVLSGTAQDLLR